MSSFRAVSPVDGSVFAERAQASPAELDTRLDATQAAARAWGQLSLAERERYVAALLDEVEKDKDACAAELTTQMGRPARHTAGEIDGFLHRGRTMIELGRDALAPVALPDKPGFTRRIERRPLGVSLILAPWNYPWLTAVNAIVPSLLAGNAVLLKHAEQTPLVAERISAAAARAGLPEFALSHIHMSHETTATAVADRRVAQVAFTGSVEGGRAVSRAAAGRFISVGYELGGKDAAYVCEDVDVAKAAAAVVDGAMYNAGQSCCGVERVYVHERIADAFVEAAVAEARALVLGDPREESTTLGPVVRERNAAAIRAQVEAAKAAGAQALVDAPAHERGACYLPPEVLVGVDHRMDVMWEETFGPVVGIMRVSDDAEAIRHVNDSRYGLTASVWTPDLERAERITADFDVGTVFMNRCDYLDPELAWTGVRDSGRGQTLSRFGFEGFTRLKSVHLRHVLG